MYVYLSKNLSFWLIKTAAKIKSYIRPLKGFELVGRMNCQSERAISSASALEL